MRLRLFIKKTFELEGEFQNNPSDLANWYKGQLYGTIYGITARNHFPYFIKVYEAYQKDKDLALQYAMDFYRTSSYWNPLYDEIIDSSLAFKIWDFGVNASPRRAVKILQQCINEFGGYHLVVDGMFGPKTLYATNQISRPQEEGVETDFYYNYVLNIIKFYKKLKLFNIFGRGWIRRANVVFNGAPNLPIK